MVRSKLLENFAPKSIDEIVGVKFGDNSFSMDQNKLLKRKKIKVY